MTSSDRTGADWALLDNLFTDILHSEDDALRAARASADAAGLPRIEVSAQHAKLLSLLVRISGARRVLEIGTLGGYSTIALARAVGADGSVVTLEYAQAHADVARGNLERAGVADRVEIVVGAALDSLPALQQRGDTFDLVFIDADKPNYSNYYDLVFHKVRDGGFIIADNVLWSGKVTEVVKDENAEALDAFNRKVLADDRVENVLLPIRDGLMVMRKKSAAARDIDDVPVYELSL